MLLDAVGLRLSLPVHEYIVGVMVSEDASPVGVVPSHEVGFIHALKVAINCVVVRHIQSVSCVIKFIIHSRSSYIPKGLDAAPAPSPGTVGQSGTRQTTFIWRQTVPVNDDPTPDVEGRARPSKRIPIDELRDEKRWQEEMGRAKERAQAVHRRKKELQARHCETSAAVKQAVDSADPEGLLGMGGRDPTPLVMCRDRAGCRYPFAGGGRCSGARLTP